MMNKMMKELANITTATEIRWHIGDMPFDRDGRHATGREVLINGNWEWEFEGDPTCGAPLTEPMEEYYLRLEAYDYGDDDEYDDLPFEDEEYPEGWFDPLPGIEDGNPVVYRPVSTRFQRPKKLSAWCHKRLPRLTFSYGYVRNVDVANKMYLGAGKAEGILCRY